MSRIRTIKPSFWTSQTLARVSRDARLVFIGLWNEADDAGRLPYSAKRLAGALFPFDSDVDATWMDGKLYELSKAGAIIGYGAEGGRYISIPKFLEHQVINRPRPSALPEPSPAIHGALTEASVIDHGALTESSVKVHGGLTEASVEEWNGMEWKRNGREEEGDRGRRTATTEPKKKKTTARKKTHQDLETVLRDIHQPSGKRYADHWAQKFGRLHTRGLIRDELEDAWDHVARTKRTDMPRYLEKWLRGSEEKIQAAGIRAKDPAEHVIVESPLDRERRMRGERKAHVVPHNPQLDALLADPTAKTFKETA